MKNLVATSRGPGHRRVPGTRRIPATLVLAACLLSDAGAALASSCGAPLSADSVPRANDCLFILRAAVGLESCRPCVCDTTGSADVAIGASDAHLCLKAAVGADVALSCPECMGTTTTLEPVTTTLGATTTTTLGTTTTSTMDVATTTTMLPGACPAFVEWTTHAGHGPLCSSNADCDAGACDPESGRCRTATQFDPGWTGFAHDQDLGDGTVQRVRVACESSGPLCGACEVTGVDPAAGNCRCASDVSVACDEPFANDPDCPGGGECRCYASAPLPISAGATPYCLVELFDAEPSGMVDVDSGSASITSVRRTRVHLGESTRAPCPICGGRCSDDAEELCGRDEDCDGEATCELDAVAGDGIRAGACGSGANQGQPCDVTAIHSSFPVRPFAAGGAGYSIDCQPSVGTNVTGSGARVRFTETTGASTLAANLSCGGASPELSCPCASCSFDKGEACTGDEGCAELAGACSGGSGTLRARCTTDDECLGVDAGPCSSTIHRCNKATQFVCATNEDCASLDLGACLPSTCGAAAPPTPLPNWCEDFSCTDDGSGEGECTTGPDVKFCDGFLTAGGRGVLACSNDEDCAPWIVQIGGSTCTHVERLRCFVDPVAALGTADPVHPLLVSTYCGSSTAKTSFNEILGLPGPVRVRRQTTMRAFCAADPAKPYEPGVGGCLP